MGRTKHIGTRIGWCSKHQNRVRMDKAFKKGCIGCYNFIPEFERDIWNRITKYIILKLLKNVQRVS